MDISDIPLAPKVELNLETSKLNSFNLDPLTSLFESNSEITDSIAGVYSAIDIEKKAKGVEEKMQKQYEELLNKTLGSSEVQKQKNLKDFGEARSKLQTKSPRGKRSAVDTTLSQGQRVAVGKMYTLNNSLKKVSENLILELRNKVPDANIPLALPQERVASVKSIESALKKIGWTERNVRTQRVRGRTNFISANSWGSWGSNPFKHFYSRQEEYVADIKSFQNNAKAVYSLQQSLARDQAQIDRFRGPVLKSTLTRQFEEKKQLIASLQASEDSHIVNKVASTLLRYMGQDK